MIRRYDWSGHESEFGKLVEYSDYVAEVERLVVHDAEGGMMKERGLICTDDEVLAFQDGRKTRFCEPIKPQPKWLEAGDGLPAGWQWDGGYNGMNDRHPLFCCGGEAYSDEELQGILRDILMPHIALQPGDRVYVRETWDEVQLHGGGTLIRYKASSDKPTQDADIWRSPAIMPKWATRIWLEIIGAEAMRIQDITPDQAQQEGNKPEPHPRYPSLWADCWRRSFFNAWNTRYAKRGFPVHEDPWIWSYTCKRETLCSKQ